MREIAPEANRQKATIQVKVAILGPDEYLRPETNAKVNFLDDTKETQDVQESQILVPKAAIVSGSGFLLRDGRAARQNIQTGKEFRDQVQIVSGLQGGERLIVRGLDGIVDGEKVSPKQQ